MSNDTDKLNKWVRVLKGKGIIKFDSHIAKALNYKRGTISQMLSGAKPVSDKFLTEFRKRYSEYLEEESVPVVDEKIANMEAEIKVLKETIVSLCAQVNGKQPSLISAELDEAVRLRKK